VASGQPVGYGGIVFEFFNAGPLNEYFCDPNEIWVLGCDCAEVGCWPLICRVGADGDLITWDAFSQPHRKDRDYSAFGPFTFNSAQYLDAIRSLQNRFTENTT